MSIPENIANRELAETAATELAELVRSEICELERLDAFWKRFDELTRPDLHKQAETPVAVPQNPSADTGNELVDDLLDEIHDIAENENMPSRGLEMAADVLETARDIAATVEAQDGFATDNQIQALLNMRDGLAKWI